MLPASQTRRCTDEQLTTDPAKRAACNIIFEISADVNKWQAADRDGQTHWSPPSRQVAAGIVTCTST